MAKYIYSIILYVVFCNVAVNAQHKLQYNLKIGDSIKVYQIANQNIVQDMNGSKHEISSILEGDFTFIVTKTNDSSYIINFYFDRFKMITNSNLYGELLSVDTSIETPEDDIQGKVFSGLIDSTLEMELLKTGKIKQITGTDNMVSKMITNAGISDDFTKELIAESMKNEFGNESLARSFEQMTFIYSENEVKIGDSWTNNFEGDLKANNVWTLNVIDDNINISGRSEVVFLASEENHTMNLTGIQETSIIANKQNGFVKLMEVISETNGVTIMNQMSDIEIPTTIKSTITFKTGKDVQ